jgi:hypothetical protein
MTRTATAHTFQLALLASALLLSVAANPIQTQAQQPTGAGTSQNAPDQSAAQSVLPPVPKTALDQFSWLVGYWQGQWGPRLAQQVWMPPHSGVMVGAFELSENNKTLVIELFTILSTPSGIELRVRHFTPSLTPWEKSGPSRLNLKSINAKSFIFENAGNRQPKRWVMERTGADAFVARFEIVPETGEQQVAKIVYHREPASVPARR